MTRKMTGPKNSRTGPWLHPMFAARKLQMAAARTLPLYVRIACDPAYAARLARSINNGHPGLTMRLINKVLPFVGVSVGAGFGTAFKMGGTYLEIGTYRPGKKVSARNLQFVAKTMLPLLKTIAASCHFSIALLQQHGKNNKRKLLRLITAVVIAKRIKDAGTDPYGFYFTVRSPGGANYNFTLYIY